MKHFALLFLLLFGILSAGLTAQDEGKSSLSVSTDLVSRYVWRGLEFGNSPAIQPTLEFSRGKFAAGFWGSYATNGANVQEADLYLSYNISDAFSITVTDYFFPNHEIMNNNYFEYNDTLTSHVFEGMLSFAGTEKFPISMLLAVNFYGADARNIDGDLFYSTYVELGYSGELNGTPFDVFLGLTPNKADEAKGESGFYGNTAGVINLGLTAHKEIRISDGFKLPLHTSLIFNPQAENVFLVMGLSL